MANFKVILDACVMFPYPVADLIMWQSETGMFHPQWSKDITDEAISGILRKYSGVNKKKIQARFDAMEMAVEEPIVKGYESLVNNIKLPDPNDRHVVAAAIKTNAELIITFNLKDFPKTKLEKFGIVAIHPDDFLCDLADIDKGLVLEKVRLCRMTYKNPPYGQDDYIDLIKAQNLKRFANVLSENRLSM